MTNKPIAKTKDPPIKSAGRTHVAVGREADGALVVCDTGMVGVAFAGSVAGRSSVTATTVGASSGRSPGVATAAITVAVVGVGSGVGVAGH